MAGRRLTFVAAGQSSDVATSAEQFDLPSPADAPVPLAVEFEHVSLAFDGRKCSATSASRFP